MEFLSLNRPRAAAAAVLCLGASLLFTGCGDNGAGQGAGTVQQSTVAPDDSSGAALAPEEQSTGAGAKRGQ
jgi:hypothetical protein